jgi:hypothetical protein
MNTINLNTRSNNESNKEIDDTYVALEVIGEINVGDKLVWDTSCNHAVNIQQSGPFRAVRRIISGENRNNTITNLQNIVNKSIKSLQEDDGNVRLKNSLIKANHGLTNLSKTYETDKHIVGCIKVMQDDILESINE